MRPELFYNPLLLLDRAGQWAAELRRVRKLRGTVASCLMRGHIDSLEMLEEMQSTPLRFIYDIGACVGTWTLLAKALYPEGEIYAFEPLPAHIERFLQTTKGLPGVHLHPVGLGSQPDQAVMKVTDFSDASSLLPLAEAGRQQWHLKQVAEIPVQVERLDDYVASHQLPAPDLIKMDVQGFEIEVLRGAGRCLAQAKWVLTEASFKHFYQEQCLFDQLVGILASAGFRVHSLGHGTALGQPLVQADVLFARDTEMVH